MPIMSIYMVTTHKYYVKHDINHYNNQIYYIFSCIYIEKKQNQDTKCVMTIMIRDGLKMGAAGCGWA